MKISIVAVMAGMLLLGVGMAQAAVINFDDLTGSGTYYEPLPLDYAGLSWGITTGQDGNTSQFYYSNDLVYSTPQSSPNFVLPWFGAELWFTFPTPVTFNGAWFANTEYPSSATQVRFTDDLGDYSPWLDLTGTPQYLQANFAGAQTIYVEGQGGSYAPWQWYTMDDVTYNASSSVPEPTSLLLLGTGLGVIGLAAWRRRK